MDSVFKEVKREVLFDEKNHFKDVIEFLSKLAMDESNVFRGYGKQDELLPNLVRMGKKYADHEKEFLKAFERYGSNYFQAISIIDFLSYAQHFGLPTRLLDFTHNPFIALAFALYKKKTTKYSIPDDADYYYIRYASLNDNMVMNTIPLEETVFSMVMRTESLADRARETLARIDSIPIKSYVDKSEWADSLEKHEVIGDSKEKFLDKLQQKRILFVDPNQSNQRIIMQQGLFMLPYSLSEEEHLEILKSNTFLVKIHKSFREDLLQYLDMLGINSFRLMPDLANICDAIRKKVMDT